jgi:hypothetical protein
VKSNEGCGCAPLTYFVREKLWSPLYLLKRVEKLTEVDSLTQYALDIAGMLEAAIFFDFRRVDRRKMLSAIVTSPGQPSAVNEVLHRGSCRIS